MENIHEQEFCNLALKFYKLVVDRKYYNIKCINLEENQPNPVPYRNEAFSPSITFYLESPHKAGAVFVIGQVETIDSVRDEKTQTKYRAYLKRLREPGGGQLWIGVARGNIQDVESNLSSIVDERDDTKTLSDLLNMEIFIIEL